MANRELAEHQQELDAILREQKMDTDSIENEKRKQKELELKVAQKDKELQDTKQRVERFDDLIK